MTTAVSGEWPLNELGEIVVQQGVGTTNIVGYARAAITAAVAANSTDKNLYLIDLGTGYQTGLDGVGGANQYASDALHRNLFSNARVAAGYVEKIFEVALGTVPPVGGIFVKAAGSYVPIHGLYVKASGTYT